MILVLLPGFMNEARMDIPIGCGCGRVRGVARDVTPDTGFRFTCYCRDCQAFAHLLKRPDVLDDAGGTDIFHMPAGRVKLDAGTDAVRCMQFSGKVFRWYACCCRTPIANTAGPRFPIVGLIHSFMRVADGNTLNEMLGARLCRIFEDSAIAPLPPNAPPPRSFGLIAHRLPTLLGWWLRGQGWPHPFFDPQTNAALAAPRLVGPEERAAALAGP
jgi:Family of unknown function (DUF6151)